MRTPAQPCWTANPGIDMEAVMFTPGRDAMTIRYRLEPELGPAEFREVLVASTLAARRPVQDLARLDKMLRQAGIIATARDGERLVGVARAITDFSYCCYLSDLAVDEAYQHRGIGAKLVDLTRDAAGPEALVVILAAPAATNYYAKLGLQHAPNCWISPRRE
jgi:GNAT superfamily N-acetyltransferase